MSASVVFLLVTTLCGQGATRSDRHADPPIGIAFRAAGFADWSRPSREVFAPAATARFGPIAMGDSREDGSSDSRPKSTPRDNFDIPWPGSLGDAASAPADPEKLDKIIHEHNKLFADWKRERHRHDELVNNLNKVAGNLQRLQNRADAVGRTMNKIRGIIGDQNADNADVFAPPETPRWNQSLAKTYTLRTGEMGRLNAKATRAMNEFNATLKNLDANADK
jgi:hypothetical protein